MQNFPRREFIKKTASAAGGVIVAPAYIRNMVTNSPNERVNVAVVGIAGNRERVRSIILGQGRQHIRGYADIPNVTVKTICDVDESLFPGVSKTVEELYGTRPGTEFDFRNVLDDKDIDIVSLATPDHWHALQTVWACQAGKDVYVEKPACHNISEGRKMVEAAMKYNRIVMCAGRDASRAVEEGIKMVHEGKLGKVYMARAIRWAYRGSIGHTPDSPVPDGLHWDMFLGPAPYRPFSLNRYLYNWHWFWEYGTGDLGNLVIYPIDTARRALDKTVHPVKIQCTGGLFGRDDDREVPNIMTGHCVYADGTIFQFETRALPTNPEGMPDDPGLSFIYGDQGWMSLGGGGYRTYFGRGNEPGPARSESEFPPEERVNVWKNLIDCVRSRRREDLHNPVINGHLSATIAHLGNLSCRTGRELTFNPGTEKFVKDPGADRLLTRVYREPYVMPENV